MTVFSTVASNLTKLFGVTPGTVQPFCPASDVVKYDLINKVGVCLSIDAPSFFERTAEAAYENMQAALVGLAAIRAQAYEVAASHALQAQAYVNDVVMPVVQEQTDKAFVVYSEAQSYVEAQSATCLANQTCAIVAPAALGAVATIATVGAGYMLYSYFNSRRDSLDALCAENTKLTLDIADKQSEVNKLNAEIAALTARNEQVKEEIADRLEMQKPADSKVDGPTPGIHNSHPTPDF